VAFCITSICEMFEEVNADGMKAYRRRRVMPHLGYAIEAVKILLSGSAAGFAGDIGAVLTRQDILTNLQGGPSRQGRTGSTGGNR
jgi:hypothetical protein